MRLLIALIILITPFITDARVLKPLPLENDKATTPIYKEIKPVKPTDAVWLIKYYAKKHWVNEKLALNIAWCESGYRNVKSKSSSASWIYQHIARYRPTRAKKYGRWDATVFNIEANIDVSIQMIRDQGTSPWNESKYCWNK